MNISFHLYERISTCFVFQTALFLRQVVHSWNEYFLFQAHCINILGTGYSYFMLTASILGIDKFFLQTTSISMLGMNTLYSRQAVSVFRPVKSVFLCCCTVTGRSSSWASSQKIKWVSSMASSRSFKKLHAVNLTR